MKDYKYIYESLIDDSLFTKLAKIINHRKR